MSTFIQSKSFLMIFEFSSVFSKIVTLLSTICFVFVFGGDIESLDLLNLKGSDVIVETFTYGNVVARFLEVPYDVKSEVPGLGKQSIYDSYRIRPKTLNAKMTTYRFNTKNVKGLVILLHEGGFMIGSRDDLLMSTLATSIAEDGYIVSSIDYPIGVRASEADLRCVIQEGIIGIHKAIANLEDRYSIKDMNVYLVGASAGGVLALSAAFIDDGEYSRYFRDEMGGSTILRSIRSYESLHSSKIEGVVSLWGGMLDFPKIDQSDPRNILVVHGTNDDTVPIDHGYVFSSYGKHNTSWGKSTIPKMYGSRALNHFDPVFRLIELNDQGHSPYEIRKTKNSSKRAGIVFCPGINDHSYDLSNLIRSKIKQWNND